MKYLIIFLAVAIFYQNGNCQQKKENNNELLDMLSQRFHLNLNSVCYYFRNDSSVKILGMSYVGGKNNRTYELIDDQLDSVISGNNTYNSNSSLYRLFTTASSNNSPKHKSKEIGKYNLLDYLSTRLIKSGCIYAVEYFSRDSLKLVNFVYYDTSGHNKELRGVELEWLLEKHHLNNRKDYLLRDSEYAIIIKR